MKYIKLDNDKRLAVDTFGNDCWLKLSGDNYHVSVVMSKEQTKQLIDALYHAMTPPAYVFTETARIDKSERWFVMREEFQGPNDPYGLGATKELAIEDLEEKIDQL